MKRKTRSTRPTGPRSAARRRRSAPTTKTWSERHPRSARTNRTNDCRIRQVLDLELDGRRLRDWPFRELRRRHAHDLVDHLLRVQGRAHTGAQNILRALSAMAEDAITDEIAEVNWVRGVRVRASDPRVTGEHPAAAGVQLRRHARLRREGRGERADARVFTDCGLRLGEVLGLDAGTSTVRFPRAQLRTQRSVPPLATSRPRSTSARSHARPRRPSLIREAAEQDRHRRSCSRPLTGRIWHESNFRRDVWTPARAASGVDIRPHDCRHSWITHLRAAGIDDADLAQVAGHTVEDLLGTYTHALGRSHPADQRGAGVSRGRIRGRIRAVIPRRQSGTPRLPKPKVAGSRPSSASPSSATGAAGPTPAARRLRGPRTAL